MVVQGSACGAAAAIAFDDLPDERAANDVAAVSRWTGAPVEPSSACSDSRVPSARCSTNPPSRSLNSAVTGAPPVFVTVNVLLTFPLGIRTVPVIEVGFTDSRPAASWKLAAVAQSSSTATCLVWLT